MTSDDSDSNGRKDMSKEESRRRKRRIERKWLEEQKFYREHETRKQRIIEKYDKKKRQFEEGLLALTRSLVDTFRESQLDVSSSDFSSHHPVLSAMNLVRDKLRCEKGRERRESAGPSHSYESSRQVSSTSRRIESRRPRTPTPPYARLRVSRRERSYDIDSKRRDHRQETSPSSYRRYSKIEDRSRSGSRSHRSHRDSPPRRTSSTRIEEARYSRPTDTRPSTRDKDAADHEKKSRRSHHSSAHYLSPERPSTSRCHDSESPGPSRRDPEYRRPRSRDGSRYRDPETRPPTRPDSRREPEHRRPSSSDRFELVPSRPPFRDSVAYYEAAGGVPYQGYYAPAGAPGPPPPFMMPVGQVAPYIFPPGWQRPPFVPFPPHGFQPRPFMGQPPYPRWPNPGNYSDDPYHQGQGNRSWRKNNPPSRIRNQSKKTTVASSTITSSQAANPNPPVTETTTSAAETATSSAEMKPSTTTTATSPAEMKPSTTKTKSGALF